MPLSACSGVYFHFSKSRAVEEEGRIAGGMLIYYLLGWVKFKFIGGERVTSHPCKSRVTDYTVSHVFKSLGRRMLRERGRVGGEKKRARGVREREKFKCFTVHCFESCFTQNYYISGLLGYFTYLFLFSFGN